MRTLCVVPARSGSKGLRKKNLVQLLGRPLLAWTADVAVQGVSEGLWERAVLSTDTEEIATLGRSHGLETPFLRPKSLAGDKSPVWKTVRHASH